MVVQFDTYDEYVFNAIAFIRHLIYCNAPVCNTCNVTAMLNNDSHRLFASLHGNATIDDEHNVMMYFSLWDLDPRDGLFYPILEQADPPHGPLKVVRNRVIHWPGNGQAPAADYCAFTDCSTSRPTLIIGAHYCCIVMIAAAAEIAGHENDGQDRLGGK